MALSRTIAVSIVSQIALVASVSLALSPTGYGDRLINSANVPTGTPMQPAAPVRPVGSAIAPLDLASLSLADFGDVDPAN